MTMNIPGSKRAHCICALFALLRTFCNFICALFSHFNQEQSVISGRETMTCAGNRTGEMHA